MFASTDYPMLDFFWSVFIVFGFFIWIWILVMILSDLFRSRDLSGVAKTAWFVFVLLIPLLGALGYLLVRGHTMQQRAADAAEEQETAFKEYVRSAAADDPGTTASQLSKLAELRDRGILTEEEFAQQKAKILA